MARGKMVWGASLGNVIEWYDFSLFGFMAPVIGPLFFPEQSHVMAVITTYIILAASFVMRPIGALIFGFFGDTTGRKKTLLVSVVMVALPAILIGVIPTYQTIGVLAPLLLLVCRLVAGFAAGGEIGGAVTYLVESAEPDKRGLYGGIAMAGAMMGVLLSAVVANIVMVVFTSDQLAAYAWRFPFLFSVVTFIFGLYCRAKMQETPIFNELRSSILFTKKPMSRVFKHYKSTLCQSALVVAYGFIINFVIIVYLPSYLISVRGFTGGESLSLSVVALICVVLFSLLSGQVSSRRSRRKGMAILCVILLVVTGFLVPYFSTGNYAVLLCLVSFFGALEGLYFGMQMTYLTELYPSKVRYSGVAFGYNLGAAVFVGVILSVVPSLVNAIGLTETLSLVLVIGALSSLLGLALLKKQQVVFIPGLGFGEDLFKYQLHYFRDTLHAKVYIINSNQIQVNVEALAKLFPAGPLTIVAHSSLGAGVALATAAQHERVVNVICLPGWVKPNQFTLDFLKESLVKIEAGQYDEFKSQLREIAVGENYPNRAQLMSEIKAIQDAVPLLQTVRQCQLMLDEIDVTDILKDVDGRVLVVRNTENDPWYSQEDAEYFASQIKDGVSLSMDNNGHLAPYTSPVKTNALIELWINK